MANQNAERDDNRVTGLLVHDSTGAETRQVRATSSNPNALPVEVIASGTGSSSNQVQGTAADNAAATGNPVRGGAKYNSSTQTYADGDVADLQADVNGNLRNTLATKIQQDIDSILTYPRGSNYLQLTADTAVLTGAGKLTGIFVAAASATPTIKVWDNTSAAGTVLINTFTPVAATMYTFPNPRVSTGIFVDVGGTVDCTVFYDPTTT
jgi:hypothetical protein